MKGDFLSTLHIFIFYLSTLQLIMIMTNTKTISLKLGNSLILSKSFALKKFARYDLSWVTCLDSSELCHLLSLLLHSLVIVLCSCLNNLLEVICELKITV